MRFACPGIKGFDSLRQQRSRRATPPSWIDKTSWLGKLEQWRIA
jgi:hypothetical protein